MENARWRVFIVGVVFGALLTAAVGAASLWWKKDTDWSDVSSLEQPQLSAQDTNIYDMCLVQNAGNKVTCDALMRLIDRERRADAYTENEIKKMLAAGASQCDVVKWALDKNFNGTKLQDALGISAKQLHDFYQENFIKPIIANRGVVPDRVECRAVRSN